MKILFADAFPTPQLERLRGEGHECEFAPALTREELPGAVPGFEALVVRSTRVGAAALEAGDSLKLVVRAGAGTNHDRYRACARARDRRMQRARRECVRGGRADAGADHLGGSKDPGQRRGSAQWSVEQETLLQGPGAVRTLARGSGCRCDRTGGLRTRGGVRDADPGAREPAARRRRPGAPRRDRCDGDRFTREACRE